MRPRPSLADFIVIAISPALIMALVGSLVFFLAEVFYQSQYQTRLQVVLAFFVMAAVLIGRISIEEGREYATLFALPLGIVTAIALMRFVEFQGVFAQFSWIINLGLIALIWWSADRLTWDCTVIDEKEDASGEGLMQTMGLDEPAAASVTSGGDLEGTTSREEQPAKSAGAQTLWQRIVAARRRKHAPGVWVVYFSMAALPIFGMGQGFMFEQDLEGRRYTFKLLVVYVAAALGLLVTTSFLGLRRYLRQRRLEMPAQMAGAWIGTGTLLILGLLLFCMLLPRRNAEYSITHLPAFARAPENLRPSRYGFGNDGPQKDEAQRKRNDEQGRQASDQQGKAKQESDEGKGQTAGQNGEKSNEKDDGQQNQKADSQQSSQDGKKQDQQSSDSPQDQGKQSQDQQDGKQDESGEQKAESGSEEEKQRNQQQGEGQRQQEPSQQAQQQSEQQQRAEEQQREAEQQQKDEQQRQQQRPESSTTPQQPSRFNPSRILDSLGAGIGGLLKLIYWLVAILLVGFFVWKYWAQVREAIAKFIQNLRELWARLFGGQVPAAVASSEPAAPPPPRPFADFPNPFQSGQAARLPLSQLIKYSFEAFEAWAREHGCPRSPQQTPHEFAQQVQVGAEGSVPDATMLAELYCRSAFGRDGVPTTAARQLEEFWRQMQSSGATTTG